MFKNFNINRILLALLIIFIPLYPKFPLFSVTGTYVAIRLDDIIIGLCLIFWLLNQIKNKFPVLKNKVLPIFLTYFIAIICSGIISYFCFQTTRLNILFLNIFRRFEYMSLFFIAIDAINSKKDYLVPYVSFIIALIGINIYGYGQKYLNFPVISTMNSEFSKGQLLQMNIWTRISSTFAGHYDLAAYLSVALVILASFTILSKKIIPKIFCTIVWISSFYILSLTASRISIFAFWGGITVTLLLIKKYLWIIPISVLMVFTIFNSKELSQRLSATLPTIKIKKEVVPTPVPVVVAPIVETKPAKIIIPTPTIVKKITPFPTVFHNKPIEEFPAPDLDAGVARSGEIRFNVEWPRAKNAFKKNPLTGTGLGSITLATDNDYLRLLGESGILGFVTFAIIFIYFFIKTFVSKNNYNYIFLGATLTMLANAMFIDVFEASKVAYPFWIMMGIYYHSLYKKQI